MKVSAVHAVTPRAFRPKRDVRLNKEQRKHAAGVIDKAAIAYFAVVGYTAYSASNWLLFFHAVVLFTVLEFGAIWMLRETEVRHDS